MLKRMLLLSLFFYGCGAKTTPSSLKEAMNWLNAPGNLPGANGPLKVLFDTLPDKGGVAVPVWQGYWYPSSQNGTARKPNMYTLSPMEKYDQAIEDSDEKATNWEIEDSKQYKGIAWAGHCNGLAAASTMVKEPKHAVTYNGVSFTVEDIKALLIELWQKGGTTVGGRCNNKEITYDSNGRIVEDECRDLNPATFHILTTNFLGVFQKPVIVDIDPSEAVWNYPIVSYEVKYKQKATLRDVTYWLFNEIKDTYVYNPSAVSFEYVQTEILLSTDNKKIYEYILELDANGNIIGGEWYRNSKSDHPDFMWRHTTPTPANPYLNIDVVNAIYQSSLN